MATDPIYGPARPFTNSEPAGRAEPCASRDLELLERLKLQDQLAIAELYDRYSRLVFSVARHVLYDEGAAEDVTQEVFLQLWRNPDSFRPERGTLSTWLTVVSRHRAIDKFRKRQAEVDVADVIIPIDGKQFGEAHLRQAADRIDRLLAEMPLHLRSTIQLAYFEGLTHSEISARTGDPLGTVKSRIRIGLDWIRKRLNGLEP